MSSIQKYAVRKTERINRVNRGRWTPDGAITNVLRSALYMAGAPVGTWMFDVRCHCKCASNTPVLKFDSIKQNATMFTVNVRAKLGSDARFEVALYYEGAKMPPFNPERLTHAAMVYSALSNNLKARRLAMAALPNGISTKQLSSEMEAELLLALGFDAKVSVEIILRGLVVEGDLCQVASSVYVVTRPNKVRLRADIQGLNPEKLAILRLLLADVEKNGMDAQKREPTPFVWSEVGPQKLDLVDLQELVPGIIFACREAKMIYEPMCEAAATIVASLGQTMSLPPYTLEAAEARVNRAVTEHNRLHDELVRIAATHPDLEVALDDSTLQCERLEAMEAMEEQGVVEQRLIELMQTAATP